MPAPGISETQPNHGNESSISDLNSEIRDYLNANVEASQTDVLEYWRIKTSIYPLLAGMARCYLAIPATSAPSEREWYRTVGTLDPAPYNKTDDGFDSDDIKL
ncbi:hypothetical protein PCANC_20188 [Puccinia coronata f. sp. avenae]|uniref:HAT C-terminal dimerisation domain-containing protein n=1 Tax=Puccinia coronata f. sp. avenae TaxID=200324 RepID=A0A2N5TW74_9BASI|nr:hypothetical protein PCANC_20188 [Puccinia coronata f. sp. avenae]